MSQPMPDRPAPTQPAPDRIEADYWIETAWPLADAAEAARSS